MKVQVDSGLREERINIPREFVPVFIFEDDGRSGRDNVVLVLLAVLSMLDHYHNRRFFVPVKGLLPVCWVIPRWLKITSVYSSQNSRRTLKSCSPSEAHSYLAPSVYEWADRVQGTKRNDELCPA